LTELNFAVRIFSLNYDLCLEHHAKERPLEMGFDKTTESWDFRRFEARDEEAPHIYLYKLHGSITWYREKHEGNILKLAATPQAEPDLIFGTDYKMQYIDPYLFYAYELRRYSLEAKIILTIGYSFRDDHINRIITQALQHDQSRVLVAVSRSATGAIKQLGGSGPQYRAYDQNAAAFLRDITIAKLENLAGIPHDETPFTARPPTATA
ncbi:MAG: SIR2 family protein, partial [Acidobacteriia bacterium]|nr:SIR2 family protein [Terriglobia bacterium]